MKIEARRNDEIGEGTITITLTEREIARIPPYILADLLHDGTPSYRLKQLAFIAGQLELEEEGCFPDHQARELGAPPGGPLGLDFFLQLECGAEMQKQNDPAAAITREFGAPADWPLNPERSIMEAAARGNIAAAINAYGSPLHALAIELIKVPINGLLSHAEYKETPDAPVAPKINWREFL